MAFPILEVLDWTGFPVGLRHLSKRRSPTGEPLQLLRVASRGRRSQQKFSVFRTIYAEEHGWEMSHRRGLDPHGQTSLVSEQSKRIMTSSFDQVCDTGWLPPSASPPGLPPPSISAIVRATFRMRSCARAVSPCCCMARSNSRSASVASPQ